MELAFIYLRVSGRGQIEGDGPERQRIACQEYADRHGITIAQEFFEEGISGKSELANRPALSNMLAAMEESGIKTIVIEKLDRLARDLMVSETILADLKKSGYTLISTHEPDLCNDDPSRKLVRQIFSAIAEYDRAMTVLKLKGARDRARMREGRCEGAKPYGAYPGEMECLERMHELRRTGHNIVEVVQTLNAEGYRARGRKPHGPRPWTLGSLHRILSRPLPIASSQTITHSPCQLGEAPSE